MKIGINAVAPTPGNIGGSEVYVINLLDKLGTLDPENEYYIFVSKNNAELYNFSFPNYRKVVCDVNSSSTYARIFYEHVKLPGVVKKYKLDLFHAPQTTAPFRVPHNAIVTIHETIRFSHPNLIPKSLKYYYALNHRLIADKVSRVIAVSETSAAEVRKFMNFPCDRVVSVYNGVSEMFLNYKHEDKGNTLSLPDEYILWVGKPYPHKNLSTLIDAFDLLHKNYDLPHSLVLVGFRGLESENIIKKINTLNLADKIKIMEFVPNTSLPEIYYRASLLALPSFYESFGIPIVEAMATGTPVLGSKTTPAPEILAGSGIVVDPGNKSEMAEAIGNVLSDEKLRCRLVTAGYERGREFTWEKTAQKTLKLYSETAV